MTTAVRSPAAREQRPFDVAWQPIDGLDVRYATGGTGGEKVVLVGAGASTYPLDVDGALKSMIEAEPLPPLNAGEVIAGFLGSIRGYDVPPFVREDYLASYAGDRLTRSAALVRAYPKDLAVLAPRLASIELPVAIVVGRNDAYGLARDAARLRERLPHARLNVLKAGHCVWEERAPEFESIVTQGVNGGFSL